MAQQAVRIARGGNEAYNFDMFAPQPQRRPAPQTRPKVRVEEGSRAEVRRRRQILGVLVMVFLLAVLGALVLNTYAQVGEMSQQLSNQQDQLNNERATYTDLVYQLESRTNMVNVEERAMQMGMVKVDKSQVTYIRVAEENTIEVQQGPLAIFWQALVAFLKNLFGL